MADMGLIICILIVDNINIPTMSTVEASINPIPTKCCHVIYNERADSASAGRNRVKIREQKVE